MSIVPEPAPELVPQPVILVADRDGVGIQGPSDPSLGLLWSAAQSKFELQHETLPQTGADWNEVTAEFTRLMGKSMGSLAETVGQIRERCEEAPGGD
jgi:hypothetical protein